MYRRRAVAHVSIAVFALSLPIGAIHCGSSFESALLESSNNPLDASVSEANADAPPVDGTASDGGPSTCKIDSDCPALKTEPQGCAIPRCEQAKGVCTYSAADKDLDTHPTAVCRSLVGGMSVTLGDDCDDANSDLYPGHPSNCSDLPDGGVANFPGGNPKGECRYGKKECLPNGGISACTGVVVPRTEDCTTATKDEDCEGSPDNGCPCTPLNGSRACAQHPGRDGVGICRGGMQSCGPTGWSACTGYVDPKSRDCSSALDNDCDGRTDNTLDTVCKCAPGTTALCNPHPGKDNVGICRAGSQSCILASPPTSSSYSACSGSVDPVADDCEANGNDNDCDGIRGNGASCTKDINVYVRPSYACSVPSSSWPDDIYLVDQDDPAGAPNGYVFVNRFRAFRAGSGSKIAMYRCRNTTSGYHAIGLSQCRDEPGRLLGFISNVGGGNGWVQLAEIYGKNFGPTGFMRSDAPECCSNNCAASQQWVLK